MFNINIMNSAEIFAEMGYPFDKVKEFLNENGFDLSYDMTPVLKNEETFTLGNGWIVCELM